MRKTPTSKAADRGTMHSLLRLMALLEHTGCSGAVQSEGTAEKGRGTTLYAQAYVRTHTSTVPRSSQEAKGGVCYLSGRP